MMNRVEVNAWRDLIEAAKIALDKLAEVHSMGIECLAARRLRTSVKIAESLLESQKEQPK